jgi:hypothetical protein
MTNRFGLWIDHKQAVIVILGEQTQTIKKVKSGVERHIRYRGATHPKSPYSAQYQQGDDQLDNQYTVHLNKYYADIISQIRGADSLLIFGPGEAKSELKTRLGREKGYTKSIQVETSDKLTDRQIVAKVRKHFADVGSRP